MGERAKVGLGGRGRCCRELVYQCFYRGQIGRPRGGRVQEGRHPTLRVRESGARSVTKEGGRRSHAAARPPRLSCGPGRTRASERDGLRPGVRNAGCRVSHEVVSTTRPRRRILLARGGRVAERRPGVARDGELRGRRNRSGCGRRRGQDFSRHIAGRQGPARSVHIRRPAMPPFHDCSREGPASRPSCPPTPV